MSFTTGAALLDAVVLAIVSKDSTARWAWAPPLPGWMASVPLPQS